MNAPELTLISLLSHRRLSVQLMTPARQVRKLFRRYPHLCHLPIVSEDKRYLALLPEKALHKVAPDTPVESLTRVAVPPLPPYATIYDAVQQMDIHKVSAIAVATEEGTYLGLITSRDLLHWWGQLGAVREPGPVMILEMALRDYSLAEIAQILESDEIRILSAYLMPHESDIRRTYVVLKVNSIYLTRSVELLERKGYTLVALHGDAMMEKQAREQLSALLRYLDI